MSKLKFTHFCLFIILFFCFRPAQATILLIDNFEYVSGDSLPSASNGWVGFYSETSGSSGSLPMFVTENSLAYTNYLSSDIGNSLLINGHGRESFKSWTPVTRTTGGKVYASFLVNFSSVEPAGAGDIIFSLNTGTIASTTLRGAVLLKKDATTGKLAFGVYDKNISSVQWSGYLYDLNTTYLLVLKYYYGNTGANEYAQLIVNPPLGATEPVSGWSNVSKLSSGSASTISGAFIYQMTNQAVATTAFTGQIDGLRIGTTWADVGDVAAASSNVSMPISTTKISGLDYNIGTGGPSAEKSFTVSGNALTDNISITSTGNYEISTGTGASFAKTSPIVLSQTAGTVASNTVYVRLKTGLTEGDYFNDTITLVSGTVQKKIVLNGSVTNGAQLTAISVDNINMEYFKNNAGQQPYYLPYSQSSIPVIVATTRYAGASYVIEPATNLDGSELERTSKITVTAENKLDVMVYNIVFQKLPNLDLYLCIGQSNMAGRAPMDALLGDYDDVPNAYLFNGLNQFSTLRNPTNRFSNIRVGLDLQNLMGPVFYVAKTLTANQSHPVGFVVNAQGGTNIELWMKGATAGLYASSMTRALEAKKWGTFKAVLWHQGESNYSTFATSTPTYHDQLIQLVADLRADLGDPNLLFVDGEIGHWRPPFAAFNSFIVTTPDFITHSAVVSAEGLLNIDTNHFNRDGQMVLGQRYGEQVLSKVYSIYTNNPTNRPSSKLKIFSANSAIRIVLNDSDVNLQCKIFDSQGKLLFSTKLCSEQSFSLPKGMYMVSVSDKKDQQIIKVLL